MVCEHRIRSPSLYSISISILFWCKISIQTFFTLFCVLNRRIKFQSWNTQCTVFVDLVLKFSSHISLSLFYSELNEVYWVWFCVCLKFSFTVVHQMSDLIAVLCIRMFLLLTFHVRCSLYRRYCELHLFN